MPVRPHPLVGKRYGRLNANVCSPEFYDCVSKTRSTNEVVLQEKCSATLLLPSHESTASLLPPVFNTQSSNSGLHTFALRRPCLLPASERGRMGVNYSIFIYFCSHRSYVSAYAHVATGVQIILYALPVATLTQAYIANRPLLCN